MKSVGFATYREIPEFIEDDLPVVPELKARDIEVSPLIWDDPAGKFKDFDAVIIRSCWNYHLKLEQFKEWMDGLDRRGVPIWNPKKIIEWNLDKVYLKDLEQKGVTIPKTIWVEPGTTPNLEQLLIENGIDEAVIKPTVSLSAYRTWRTSITAAKDHQREFAELVESRGVMIQSFIDEVITKGEISFLFFGGKYSHAVYKRPKKGDFRVQEDYGGSRELFEASEDLIEQASKILDRISEPLLYTRVDAVEVNGKLTLMELELIDPVLFLKYDSQAPRRFAEAIMTLI